MNADTTVARRVVVEGMVQGVFFRDTCRRMAASTGVAGWVRNRPDGRVEAWFEGDRAGVDRMVDWCRHGPPGARVIDVDVVPETPAGESRFRIR
ncbi:MAG TPA: acylphosphatase [Acidimicrobiales bacterium]|nr:acylphosphatase [Acidimicrobiales bacterium]